jgi:hypothetical protein
MGYFMTIWKFCVHLVHFSCFGIMHQEKSGNPARDRENIFSGMSGLT